MLRKRLPVTWQPHLTLATRSPEAAACRLSLRRQDDEVPVRPSYSDSRGQSGARSTSARKSGLFRGALRGTRSSALLPRQLGARTTHMPPLLAHISTWQSVSRSIQPPRFATLERDGAYPASRGEEVGAPRLREHTSQGLSPSWILCVAPPPHSMYLAVCGPLSALVNWASASHS